MKHKTIILIAFLLGAPAFATQPSAMPPRHEELGELTEQEVVNDAILPPVIQGVHSLSDKVTNSLNVVLRVYSAKRSGSGQLMMVMGGRDIAPADEQKYVINYEDASTHRPNFQDIEDQLIGSCESVNRTPGHSVSGHNCVAMDGGSTSEVALQFILFEENKISFSYMAGTSFAERFKNTPWKFANSLNYLTLKEMK